VQTPIGATMVSIGVASYPESAISATELVYGAQAAMYWAKANGGDKVGYWGELVCSPDGTAWRRKGAVSDPVAALVATLERKTWAPAGQTSRSAWYAKQVAKEMRLSEEQQELIHTAALLHDIGKLATPDEILLKPGPLTDEEKEIARQHPLVGAEILARMPSLAQAAPIVAHHHEHYDGSGYPKRLQGEQIPIGSRIILVSDAFDAMTTHRSYRSVMSLQMAMRELQRCAGQQFDPRVANAFMQIVSRQGLSALHWSQGGGR
jgi:putative nucleotidyltransferase with HDIG domain